MENQEKCLIKNLYRQPQRSLAYPFLERFDYPWQALAHITEFILQLGETLSAEEYNKIGEDIWIAKSAKVADSASISGPCIICPNNYVGDSILGYKAHMGAGSITSNVKGDKSLVTVCMGKERIPTDRKKCGAMLGDYVEVGCNSVLNPGTVVGVGTQIYPLSLVRGYIDENCIFKSQDNIVKKR